MGRLFGTDGVRGRFGVDLTAELAHDLAAAAASVLVPAGGPDAHGLAVVGRDTRPSGPDLEAAITEGLRSAGVDVRLAGVVPTPAVAYLVDAYEADLGVMISASHNPAPDNGIKFFARAGHKLDDAVEDAIAERLGAVVAGQYAGEVADIHERAVADYVAHLVDAAPHRLDGVRVVVDCANGAAASVAYAAYSRAGADVVLINDGAGERINDGCGATYLDAVRAAVIEHGADAGIAHDGDADRCIAVDASGEIVDGDAILAILAVAASERGALAADTVVTTVMTNLGFRRAMAEHGIGVAVTAVGDRHVLERLRGDGLVLGGEQSGHVVLLEHATTGDGVLTALHLLGRVAQTGRSLADLAGVMTRLPQVLVNVPVADRDAAMLSADVVAAVSAVEAELGESGRVLVRPSGTEPLVRVMVEAPTEDAARAAAERVAATLR